MGGLARGKSGWRWGEWKVTGAALLDLVDPGASPLEVCSLPAVQRPTRLVPRVFQLVYELDPGRV